MPAHMEVWMSTESLGYKRQTTDAGNGRRLVRPGGLCRVRAIPGAPLVDHLGSQPAHETYVHASKRAPERHRARALLRANALERRQVRIFDIAQRLTDNSDRQSLFAGEFPRSAMGEARRQSRRPPCVRGARGCQAQGCGAVNGNSGSL
jgi:hypothetical protein